MHSPTTTFPPSGDGSGKTPAAKSQPETIGRIEPEADGSGSKPAIRISGGELPGVSREEFLRTLHLIKAEKDVHQVLILAQRVDGRFLYLIETPFATWPRFVIGLTDPQLDHVEILYRCGNEVSAHSEWSRIRRGLTPSPSEF